MANASGSRSMDSILQALLWIDGSKWSIWSSKEEYRRKGPHKAWCQESSVVTEWTFSVRHSTGSLLPFPHVKYGCRYLQIWCYYDWLKCSNLIGCRYLQYFHKTDNDDRLVAPPGGDSMVCIFQAAVRGIGDQVSLIPTWPFDPSDLLTPSYHLTQFDPVDPQLTFDPHLVLVVHWTSMKYGGKYTSKSRLVLKYGGKYLKNFQKSQGMVANPPKVAAEYDSK